MQATPSAVSPQSSILESNSGPGSVCGPGAAIEPSHDGDFPTIEPASGAVAVDLAERVAAALIASARAEAALRAMFRTVKFLGASVGAARETNEALVSELRSLRALVGESAVPPGERMTAKALEARADLLEQALGETAEQAVRDREFLIAEHDSFIASLVGDHEKELANLRRRVSEAESRLAAREAKDFDFGWDDETKR
ncbi:MAG TPA: hypothetical protein VFU02_13540 [Polyangiaceae bacterium]|nr:hypothetical protein [Polyangiaceae bacterium]